jgi:predicted esterase
MKAWIRLLAVFACAQGSLQAEDKTFYGEWKTSLGAIEIKQEGDGLTVNFKMSRIPPVKGELKNRTATLSYQEGNNKGDASIKLDDVGRSFSGWFRYNGGPEQPFNGWRPDPESLKKPEGKFGGLWLTSLGLMELTQKEKKVEGRFALRGGSDIHGDAAGGRLDYRFKAFLGGKGWFDTVEDGSKLVGAAADDGSNSWFAWNGRRAPEFARHVRLIAGKTVDGSTKGLLTYSVHTPEGYVEDSKKPWPTIVILHGSNMSGKAYVDTIAARWPEIGKQFLILGINGERPSNIGKEPSFNFSYVNYVGKSTYGGFPGTDRESPALVSEALAELRSVYPIKHYLVGGHSQGGYLTYSLLMNFPEMFAGAFPVSGEVMFICEPNAYADETLKKAQRSVPLAIVHGKTDPNVPYSSAKYAATQFGEAKWPALRLFSDENAGHMFALLPVDKAILWLETLASEDPAVLLTFAERRLKENGYRDACAAMLRLREQTLGEPQKARLKKLTQNIDDKARAGAARYLPRIKANADGSWVEGFLAYRDVFEFADAAHEVMAAFTKLRAEHQKPAQDAFNEARKRLQQGQQDGGYAKYQEIIDKHYASPLYLVVKPWLDERKK